MSSTLPVQRTVLRKQKQQKSSSNLISSNSTHSLKQSVSNVSLSSVCDSGRVILNPNKIRLEHVLGVSVGSNAALSLDPTSGTVAYPAGCTVVLFDGLQNKQSHIINVAKKTITSVCFSDDGKYLATGEMGYKPAVRVWCLADGNAQAELEGHKFGISCLAFAPSASSSGGKYLVSVGQQHDMVINVWNWRSGTKVASGKVSSKVASIAFNETGNFFVTVGVRHVKFWYLERDRHGGQPANKDTVPLTGRSAILADQRNNSFSDVACGRGPLAANTYCIAQSGMLCVFNARRLLDKWVDLKTRSANALALGPSHVFVGLADGIIRVFAADTLEFVASLPRPHHLGIDLSLAQQPEDAFTPSTDKRRYPDAVALVFDVNTNRLTAIYHDHSIYQWDITNFECIGKAYSALYHAGPVWGVQPYPAISPDTLPPVPAGSFFTCSADDTVRVWNVEQQHSTDQGPHPYHPNIYSQELVKVVYSDPDLAFLCDQNYGPLSNADNNTLLKSGDVPTAAVDGLRNGVRVVRPSPCGQHLASGDKSGNVRVYILAGMILISEVEAHDSEVTCLEYSDPKSDAPYLLASASRDRLIHVFSVRENYAFLATIDDHSAAITGVSFVFDKPNSCLRLVSCSADKSLMVRDCQMEPEPSFPRTQHTNSKVTLYDVVTTQHTALLACQDRQIRAYNLATGKHKKSYRGAIADDGSLVKLQLDASGTICAASASDKTVSLIDLRSGECLVALLGHSEQPTGLCFMQDGGRLITTGADGCVFVWRFGSELSALIATRFADTQKRLSSVSVNTASVLDNGSARDTATTSGIDDGSASEGLPSDAEDPALLMDTSVHRLPDWAKPNGVASNPSSLETPTAERISRWNQHADGTPQLVVSHSHQSSADSGFRPTDPGDYGQQQTQSVNHSLMYRGVSRDSSNDSLETPRRQNAPQIVYYSGRGNTAEPNLDENGFEVRNRIGLLRRVGQTGRADSFDNDLSDDDDLNPVAANSSPNIRAAMMAERRGSGTSSVTLYPTDTPPEVSPAQPHVLSERDSPNRQSITSRFLQRDGMAGGARRNLSPLVSREQTPERPEVQQLQLHQHSKTQQNGFVLQQPQHSSRAQSSLSTERSDDYRHRFDHGTPKWTPPQTSNANQREIWSYQPRSGTAYPPQRRAPPASAVQLRPRRRYTRAYDSERRQSMPASCHDDPTTNALVDEFAGNNRRESDLGASRGTRRYFDPSPGQMSRVSSASMTSLGGQSGAATRRISDLRDRLKKSTENLATPAGSRQSDFLSPMASSSSVSRSKSYGSLAHHSAMTSPMNEFGDEPWSTPHRPMSSMSRAGGLARSLSNLQVVKDLRNRDGVFGDRQLSRTDLSSSRHRLPHDDEEIPPEPSVEGGTFYNRAPPKNSGRRSSSSVQRRVHKILTDRMSCDSDSDAPGGYSSGQQQRCPAQIPSRALHEGFSTPPHSAYNSRMQSPMGSGGGNVPPRAYVAPRLRSGHYSSGALSSDYHSNPSSGRRPPPNYLQKMISEGRMADGEQGNVRPSTSGSDHSASMHFEKMSRHCQDSVGQFKTSLDKVLQAFQLVYHDPELTGPEREQLLSHLTTELTAAHRRLLGTLGASGSTQMQSPRSSTSPPRSADSPLAPPPVPGIGLPTINAAMGGGNQEQLLEMITSMVAQRMQAQGTGGAKH